MKLVISRLQENIRIRRAITLHSDYCNFFIYVARYGTYVHRPYAEGVGLQACVVELSVDPEPETEDAEDVINEFADDMATQVLGSPPKYLNYEEIPEDEVLQETEKAREAMAQTLAKAPEHTHDKIVAGKLLSTYYSNVLLGCMPYLLSNEGQQVSDYWTEAERNSGCNISILRALTWQCKQ
jgi:translation elongation factor EF-Ts